MTKLEFKVDKLQLLLTCANANVWLLSGKASYVFYETLTSLHLLFLMWTSILKNIINGLFDFTITSPLRRNVDMLHIFDHII